MTVSRTRSDYTDKTRRRELNQHFPIVRAGGLGLCRYEFYLLKLLTLFTDRQPLQSRGNLAFIIQNSESEPRSREQNQVTSRN